jgi:hypothetical protein
MVGDTSEGYSPVIDAITSRGVESSALRQHNRYTSHNLPYRATARVQRDTTIQTHQYRHEIHSYINKMAYFHLNFILYLLDKHLPLQVTPQLKPLDTSFITQR